MKIPLYLEANILYIENFLSQVGNSKYKPHRAEKQKDNIMAQEAKAWLLNHI